MKSLNELLTKILYQSDREPVPTGFKDLDRILDGGLKPFTTTLVAGRPGMGKTAFLLDVAMHHALTTGKTVVYFSAFESAEDIAMRVIGKHTMAHGLEKILRLKGSETKDILDAAYDAMKRIPIAVCDESKIAESEIKDICSAVDNLGMIIVDLDIRFEEDTHEKDQFIHKMTQLSTAVNAPVLCSCVVNRSVERRENKRPDLDSLGLAGILGNQQPDIIALYREDYYDYHLSADSGESAAEAIVIPFGTDNVEQYRTARIKWNYPRRRFENDVMIESSICSQSLNNVDNSHSHRWVVFYDYEPCRRDAAKSEERQYQDFVHMVKNSFDEAKELFLNKIKEFDHDEVIEQINADIAEMRFCGLTDPEGEAIASKVCAINVDIDEGAFRMSGDAGRESVPNGRDVFYFRYFNSDYHFRISENCFKMDDPEDKYFIEITHFNKDTGEYDLHFYMGLSPPSTTTEQVPESPGSIFFNILRHSHDIVSRPVIRWAKRRWVIFSPLSAADTLFHCDRE